MTTVGFAKKVLKTVNNENLSIKERLYLITTMSEQALKEGNSKAPKCNRLTFLKREFNKTQTTQFNKLHQFKDKLVYIHDTGALACVFNGTNMPKEYISEEEEGNRRIENKIVQIMHCNPQQTIRIPYRDLKMVIDLADKKSMYVPVKVGKAVYNARLLQKVFKFYSLSEIELCISALKIGYGLLDNDEFFLVAPMNSKFDTETIPSFQ